MDTPAWLDRVWYEKPVTQEEAEAFEMGVTPALEARMLDMIGEARTCPHGHPIGDYPREPGVPLTAAPTDSVVRILRFENEDHDLLRMFRRAGVEPRASYAIVGFDGETLKVGVISNVSCSM